MTRTTPLAAIAALALSLPAAAEASCMCMFRPATSDTRLSEDPKNPATSVFILRDGTRTVLTVEPAYEGPLTELSMIVPLPTAITRRDVRTISGHHFRRLDRRTSPRLRHRWSACPTWGRGRLARRARGRSGGGLMGVMGDASHGVEVEETWDVDEYDVALLSAEESSGLLTFLRDRGLALPDRAAPVLRSYIETGHRFALIEVDPSRAQTVGGRMVLSPLQLHYDSEELRVPVRLGTLNSPGEQELLLYVLSNEGRFEVANREALIAPAGASLREGYEGGFGAFYGGLMDELFRRHPGATVTEYARTVAGMHDGAHLRQTYWFGLDRQLERNERGEIGWGQLRDWTLTRIRYRYGADLDDDLVLRPAERLGNGWRGSSAFSVQFEVQHEGDRCPGFAERQRTAEQWATSGELWAEGERSWPGDALAEPLLGIEPGSSPPVVAAAPAPEVAPDPPALEEAVEAASPEPARAAVATSGCSVGRTGSGGGWLLASIAIGLVGRRRRGRARRRRGGSARRSTKAESRNRPVAERPG